MENYPISSEIRLGGATYIDNGILDVERIDKYLRGSGAIADMMNSQVVYAYGSSDQFQASNYPVLFQTQGMGRKKAYTSPDGIIKHHLLGKPKKTSIIGKNIYTAGDRIGANYGEFYMWFKDNHFQKKMVIVKGTPMKNYQIQLMTAGEPDSGLIKFKCKVFGQTKFIPAEYLSTGQIWGEGAIKVSLEHSRGTENRSYTPFQAENSWSVVRQSINVAGNAANKKMKFIIKVDGSTYNMYYDWEKHLANISFMATKEQDLLLSTKTKDRLGVINNYDPDSGKYIPSGNGLFGQIPSSNVLGYTQMTTRKLGNFLTDTLDISGQLSNESNAVIDVMGGFDLLTNINEALSRTNALTPVTQSSDLYVRQGKNGLQYGSYFTEYKHITGTVYRFTHHNFFDKSSLAETSPKNPFTGRSIMSSEGIVMNFGKVSLNNGRSNEEASNIEFCYEEGREYIEGTVRGMAAIEGKQGGDGMATDVDASAMHMMATMGIHCYTPLSMAYIQSNLV